LPFGPLEQQLNGLNIDLDPNRGKPVNTHETQPKTNTIMNPSKLHVESRNTNYAKNNKQTEK
jgi:hypothetical protein